MAVLAIGSGFIPKLMSQHLQHPSISFTPPSWAPKNAIVLLGGGLTILPDQVEAWPTIPAYSRILKSTQLYFDCIHSRSQCTVIISGGAVLNTKYTEAEVYTKELLKLGVKATDILLESKSLNTYQNAFHIQHLLKKGQFNKIFLVTSGLHLKRALLYFSNFNIQVYPCASDYFTPDSSISDNLLFTDLAIHEYLGMAKLYIYNHLGWNAPYQRQENR